MQREELRVSKFFCRLHVPLFRRRRNILDLRDDRSVRSALFFKDYNRYFVSISMCESVESTTFVRNIFSDSDGEHETCLTEESEKVRSFATLLARPHISLDLLGFLAGGSSL